MPGFLKQLKRKGKEAIDDVTEVFTSPFEVKELEDINKDILHDVDQEIAGHTTPLQKEQADEIEQGIFQRALERYDQKASKKLKRQPDNDENDNINVHKRKLQRALASRTGKIYSKFSSEVTALNDAAAVTMRLAVDSLTEFENSVKTRLPLLNEDLEAEIASNYASITDQVQNSFPGGVVGIDSYDDHLPEGIPSWANFQPQFHAAMDSIRSLNATRIEESRARACEILTEAQARVNGLDSTFRARFPLLPQAADDELDAALADINNFVNSSFPGGLEKLDLYDDGLPEGIPSWAQLFDRATELSSQLVAANQEAIDADKAAKKASIYNDFLAKINEAVNSSSDAIDALPLDYLTEDDRSIYRAILKGQLQTIQLNAVSSL